MVSAEESGTIILEMTDATENNLLKVLDAHTSATSQGTLTPTGETYKALPILTPSNVAGRRMIMSMVSDATDTVESEESDCIIPVFLINEKSGAKQLKVLKLEDFTGFKPSASVDITLTASIKGRLGTYDAPNGYLVQLAGGQKYHVYVGDDTA